MLTYVGVLLGCLFLPFVQMVTLEQALTEPDKYIRYETGEFNIGKHVGLSLVINFGILSASVGLIVIVSKTLGYHHRRHG
ncbi:hypothetical protein EWB00_005851 [Schistosoma japonicum]|uniref:DUF4149 domain-containing protein n=1 Tax=Schistosoma japonicum TaxID=6182 RepID=A0A4Z2D0G4_SCHJA|nr:hypothetical protein KSF78_0009272 [Schistosoma japonicum]KAH8856686.1 hypothetical protein KSF78_0009272 [Schistosoma japonicum]TNN09973.1 hypothetical protein EWB00_005851 [Schistosoma japonicum]TNN09974.1 hypothetical protein EWB00_005851 [Schistosoma japonicum]